jgi:hypothetical protein
VDCLVAGTKANPFVSTSRIEERRIVRSIILRLYLCCIYWRRGVSESKENALTEGRGMRCNEQQMCGIVTQQDDHVRYASTVVVVAMGKGARENQNSQMLMTREFC